MDNLNDRIRNMFDLVGNSITNNIRSLHTSLQKNIGGGSSSVMADSKGGQKSATKVGRISSVSSLQSRTRNSKSQASRRNQVRRHETSASRSRASGRKGSNPTLSGLPFASGLNLYLAESKRSRAVTDRSAIRRYNCGLFYIHCLQHQKVMVTKPSRHQAVYMPFMPLPENQSWNDGGHAALLIILSNGNMDQFMALRRRPPFTSRSIIEVAAIQLPQTMEIIKRITWLVDIDVPASSNGSATNVNKLYKCCTDSDEFIWVDECKLDQGTLEYMWGPELIEFYRLHVHENQSSKPMAKCNFVDYNLEMAFQFLPRNPPRTDEESMLLSSNLTEKDIERLYSDFLDHCFPSMSMAFHSFKVYMTKIGFQFEDERLTHLFFAFNYNNNGFITFPELIMGLACIECHSTHNEVRAKFVMRYYDVHKRNYLTRDDIRVMLLAIHTKMTPEEIDQKLAETMAAMEPSMNDPNKITYRNFVGAVGSHKFRGTSRLCRADRPVFQMISNIIFTRKKKRDMKDLKLSAAVVEPGYSGTCSCCQDKVPILDETMLQVDKNGNVNGRQKCIKLDPFSSQPGFSSLSPRTLSALQTEHFRNNDEVLNTALSLIEMIRDFATKKGDTRRPLGFMAGNNKDRGTFHDMLLVLERRLLRLFESESRCVVVESPAYIIGDIHGNLDDLLTLEQCIWKRFPAIDVSLVFLGDYVDRGRWSIESVTYLFCLKVVMPFKVTLLRGNHEVRPLQAHYTFRNECFTKYGDEYGEKIWQLTNRLFDRLPLSAIIDEAIFCAHGGIPRSAIDVADIQRIPNCLSEPEHASAIAWEILWSDPIHQQQFLELACILNHNDYREGYLPNRKRGTAYVFNEDAATAFLKQNGLTQIVRAHEVQPNGFSLHFDKKCATIFSTSHYCGNNNECAVAFVEGDCIRIIRVDTANNKSATDI